MKHNSNNERIKRKYIVFLKDAKGQSEATVDAVAMAINRFETYVNFKDFKQFHHEQARGFKKHLAKQNNQQTGKPLSKATLSSTLRNIKTFFQWLCMQAGYKSKLNYSEMEYFNPSSADTRIATAKRQRPIPTIEQIEHVIHSMANATPIERRNRALVAFTLLSGARDSAIASMRIKHVDLMAAQVFQDAREVKTKFSKTFVSDFFPVGNEITGIVIDWVNYLKNELKYGNDDPLFPKTAMIQNDQQEFEASGLMRDCWSTASPIRNIFKQAFESAGLDYFHPHSFRKTLVGLGERLCQTPEEFKGWSQNLGHDQVLTTFTSYGEVQPQRQREIFERLKLPRNSSVNRDGMKELLEEVLSKI
jgi:integrase/recombinase XerD